MNLKSLAKIGKGTRRKKRDINLLEVAEEIKSLYNAHRSLNKVANIVKLSPEMTRQFLKITELEENVKTLIKSGLIRGVDIGYRISKLAKEDQIVLAEYIVNKNLSSDDTRTIVRYKIDNPQIPIAEVISKVVRSKDKRIYVAYLGIEKDTFENLLKKIENKDKIKIISSIFNSVISHEFIVSFELNGRVVILKVVREGLQEMRNQAKKLKVPLAKLAEALLKEYLKEIK